MKTVILTGGMGSGKSAVAAVLKARGVSVYDSDSRTKSLYDRDPALVGRLEEVLCTGLRDAAGRLDRAKLASLIFSDPARKAAVEAVVHPAVLADFRRWKRWHRPKGWTYGPVPFVVLESCPARFSTGWATGRSWSMRPRRCVSRAPWPGTARTPRRPSAASASSASTPPAWTPSSGTTARWKPFLRRRTAYF